MIDLEFLLTSLGSQMGQKFIDIHCLTSK